MELKRARQKKKILTAKKIPGSPEWKGDGIERPLNAAYEELSTS